MRRTACTVEQCKHAIESLLGKTVTIRHNKGRNKITDYRGVISEAYNGVFVLKLACTNPNRLSFSYKDIICGEVKIK